jgi:biopolymer transport protein ExbB
LDSVTGLPGSLLRHYLAGGFAMHPVTICSLAAIAAIVYKLLAFRRVRRGGAGLALRVRALLLEGRIAEAVETCRSEGGPVGLVLRAGLLKQGARRAEIESAMESVAVGEIAHLERYQGLLAGIVGFAPLLGFFGTVVAMIGAFEGIGEQGLSHAGPVAQGISTSLHATAWGLLVALVAKPFHAWFEARTAGCARDLEMASSILLESLDETERMGTAASR